MSHGDWTAMQCRKKIALRNINKQTTGYHTSAKDDNGCKNDFPVIHGAVEESFWAVSVLRKSCEISAVSFVGGDGRKCSQRPNTRATAEHEKAARHNARDQNIDLSSTRREASSAVMRFSKA